MVFGWDRYFLRYLYVRERRWAGLMAGSVYKCARSTRPAPLSRQVTRSTHTNYAPNQILLKKLASIKRATKTKLLFKVVTTQTTDSVVLITKEIELLLLYWGVVSRSPLSLRQLLKIQEAFCCCGGFYSRFARQWIPVMSVGILTRDATSAGISWQSFKRPNITACTGTLGRCQYWSFEYRYW